MFGLNLCRTQASWFWHVFWKEENMKHETYHFHFMQKRHKNHSYNFFQYHKLYERNFIYHIMTFSWKIRRILERLMSCYLDDIFISLSIKKLYKIWKSINVYIHIKKISSKNLTHCSISHILTNTTLRLGHSTWTHYIWKPWWTVEHI